MNSRIYEIQAEDVHKQDTPRGLEIENTQRLFTARPAVRQPIKINVVTHVEVKQSSCPCSIL